MFREQATSFKFFQAIAPQVMGVAGTVAGDAIDTRNFGSLTIALNVGKVASTVGTCYYVLRMQHTDASALGAGPSDYAEVNSTHVVRFDTSAAITSGVVHTVATTESNTTVYVGYVGDKRYVRVLLSTIGTMGSAGDQALGAMAILGIASQWPIANPA
jgi:hypothetical protein